MNSFLSGTWNFLLSIWKVLLGMALFAALYHWSTIRDAAYALAVLDSFSFWGGWLLLIIGITIFAMQAFQARVVVRPTETPAAAPGAAAEEAGEADEEADAGAEAGAEAEAEAATDEQTARTFLAKMFNYEGIINVMIASAICVVAVFMILFGSTGRTPSVESASRETAKPAVGPINPSNTSGEFEAAVKDKPAATPVKVTRFVIPTDKKLLAAIGGSGGNDNKNDIALAFASWADLQLNPDGTPSEKRRKVTLEEFLAVQRAAETDGFKSPPGTLDSEVLAKRVELNAVYGDREDVKKSILKVLAR